MISLPPIVLSSGVLAAASVGFGSPALQQYQSSVVDVPPNAARAAGCTARIDPAQRPASDCSWNTSATGSPVYLLGDSHGDQLSDGVIAAAESAGRPVRSAIQHGCPYTGVAVGIVGIDPGEYLSCAEAITASWRWLDAQATGTVVVAFSDHYWADPSFGILAADGTLDTDAAVSLLAQRDWLLGVVEAAETAGHDVVLIATLPVFDTDRGRPFTYRPRECSVVVVLADECSTSMPEQEARTRQAALRSVLDEIAARTGATVLDLWGSLCPDGACSTWHDGEYVYRDALHITAATSRTLAPAIARALSDGP